MLSLILAILLFLLGGCGVPVGSSGTQPDEVRVDGLFSTLIQHVHVSTEYWETYFMSAYTDDDAQQRLIKELQEAIDAAQSIKEDVSG